MSSRAEAVNFVETWKCLEVTVQSILSLDTIPRDVWHTSFNHIYYLCGLIPEPQHEKLYKSTKLLLETHVSELLKFIQTEGTENLLQNYCTSWQKYSKAIKLLECLYTYVLFYLTLYYIKGNDV